MLARQLHLFAPPKPLAQRLGEGFFRTAPRAPGVYVMTGQDGRVLYVGQSANLRARLASYKNARPDRAPRKVIRLIHAVESITWEKCESAEGARLRENELLRLYRPRFSRLNTCWNCSGRLCPPGRTSAHSSEPCRPVIWIPSQRSMTSGRGGTTN